MRFIVIRALEEQGPQVSTSRGNASRRSMDTFLTFRAINTVSTESRFFLATPRMYMSFMSLGQMTCMHAFSCFVSLYHTETMRSCSQCTSQQGRDSPEKFQLGGQTQARFVTHTRTNARIMHLPLLLYCPTPTHLCCYFYLGWECQIDDLGGCPPQLTWSTHPC